MNFKLVTLLLTLFFNGTLRAHGMNELGPHGGYIKMPGAFHTELVDKGDRLNVYLLDLNFKNPTIVDSSVLVLYKGNKLVATDCKQENDYFVCDKPKLGFKDFKTIVISSKRNKTQGKEAIYSLPLKLE